MHIPQCLNAISIFSPGAAQFEELTPKTRRPRKPRVATPAEDEAPPQGAQGDAGDIVDAGKQPAAHNLVVNPPQQAQVVDAQLDADHPDWLIFAVGLIFVLMIQMYIMIYS
jgi:hypothetical protein